MRPLVDGVDGVFCVTNFWEHGYEADIDRLERDHDVNRTKLDEYLREHDWGQ